MAQAVEAPAGTMAEGPTSHTLNQAPRLTAYQLRMLHSGINPNRVRNLRGLSHLEAWDVRRQLIRIFGFGGYSIETLSLDLVHDHKEENFRKKNKQGEFYGDPYTAWTIVYRAQIRLTVFDTQGREICHWEDGAAGDAVNQPSVGDAHDMAMKTSLSQALKRCATNLGDQFGLSLYNDSSRDAVVQFSAAHPPQEWKQAAPPQPEPEDPPVQGEPDAPKDDESASEASPTAEQREDMRRQEQAGDPKLEILDKLYLQAIEGRFNRLVLIQVRGNADKDGVLEYEVDGPPPERRRMPFRELLGLLETAQKAAQGGNTEGNAA